MRGEHLSSNNNNKNDRKVEEEEHKKEQHKKQLLPTSAVVGIVTLDPSVYLCSDLETNLQLYKTQYPTYQFSYMISIGPESSKRNLLIVGIYIYIYIYI
jgi:hypothetical protein